jgi:hypothetical protein
MFAAMLLLLSGELATAGASAPAAPADLQAMVVHDALKITLLWEDNSENEEQFILERSSEGPNGPWGVAALPPADSTMYHDSGLVDGVTYWYRIAASNSEGTSDYSNVVAGTASDLPAPQTGDADCSGTITSIDAALVLQFDAGLIDILTFTCLLVADVNEDGTTNALDATLILQFAAGLIPAFVGVTESTSGIEGMVTIGPICPVMQKGIPCPDLPFSAKIVIEDNTGAEVASVVSGDDGAFQIELDPGSYVIVPESPNPAAPPTAEQQAVEVVEDAFTDVLIQYDSGIR